MTVDSGSLLIYSDAVAFPDPNLRPGDLLVVGPGLGLPPGLYLPLDLFSSEIVHLDALFDSRLEGLVALALGFCREGFDSLFVHGIHGVCPLARGGRRRSGGSRRGAGLGWGSLGFTAGTDYRKRRRQRNCGCGSLPEKIAPRARLVLPNVECHGLIRGE